MLDLEKQFHYAIAIVISEMVQLYKKILSSDVRDISIQIFQILELAEVLSHGSQNRLI